MSDTPRTDALLSLIRQGKASAGCMPKVHGQQLERELVAMTAAKNRALGALKRARRSMSCQCCHIDMCGHEHDCDTQAVINVIKELEEPT